MGKPTGGNFLNPNRSKNAPSLDSYESNCIYNDYGYGPRSSRYMGTKPDGRMLIEVRYSSHQTRKLVKPEKVTFTKDVQEFVI